MTKMIEKMQKETPFHHFFFQIVYFLCSLLKVIAIFIYVFEIIHADRIWSSFHFLKQVIPETLFLIV